MQISTLLSIKTGGCPEDCAYCPQSAQYDTGVKAEKLMSLDAVLAEARAAKDAGASRFCMGAAWREPKDRDLDKVCAMIEGVRAIGLETCVTLGMLTEAQAKRLKASGLDYYNHNLDTSPEFYGEIITTRTYQERLDTLEHVRDAGINVCCGGIVGMGESADDRVGLIQALATLPVHPESVPINMLVQVEGTPLAGNARRARSASTSCAPSRSRASPCRVDGAALGRARGHERRDPGAVLSRRRQFDLLRAEAADHGEPGRRPRPAIDGSPRPAADGISERAQKTLRANVRPATSPAIDSSTEPST